MVKVTAVWLWPCSASANQGYLTPHWASKGVILELLIRVSFSLHIGTLNFVYWGNFEVPGWWWWWGTWLHSGGILEFFVLVFFSLHIGTPNSESWGKFQVPGCGGIWHPKVPPRGHFGTFSSSFLFFANRDPKFCMFGVILKLQGVGYLTPQGAS